ncbi:MAG TPA: hypothetical protein VH835_09295, partial [Dongiaceae bacterium]
MSATVVALGVLAGAQERPPASTADPRASLKPGFKDAGVVARNLELVATLPKPEGFFDPKEPAGSATPPETPEGRGGAAAAAAENVPAAAGTPEGQPQAAGRGGRGGAAAGGGGGGLNFANSDLAFSGQHLFMGSFHGFNTYDIENPRRPRL